MGPNCGFSLPQHTVNMWLLKQLDSVGHLITGCFVVHPDITFLNLSCQRRCVFDFGNGYVWLFGSQGNLVTRRTTFGPDRMFQTSSCSSAAGRGWCSGTVGGGNTQSLEVCFLRAFICVFVCASAPEWMFVYMGEWGWQGYNLLQTACGQRRGGRDSDTEREQAKERASGGGGSEDKHGRNELAGEKEYRKEIKKTRREGGRSRGEVWAVWICISFGCSTVPTVLSSPTHCHAKLRGRQQGS